MAVARLAGIPIYVLIGVGSQLGAQTVDVTDRALRRTFEDYYFGKTVPKNQAIAERYLQEAAQSGSDWAILLVAQQQEHSAPKKALDAYLRLAQNNNCAAQQRLVDAYASGILVKKNMTQAYFWSLLARANEGKRKTDIEYYGGKTGFDIKAPDRYSFKLCITLVGLHAASTAPLEKSLPPKLIQAAQDAATSWTIGDQEKLLPAPQLPKPVAVTSPESSGTPGSNSSPKLRPPVATESKDDWLPVGPYF
jgi:hypothetical protein